MVDRKLGEPDLEVSVLYILNKSGPLTTSELKEEIHRMLEPSGSNLDPLHNRNDVKIDQIIRNIVSHRSQSGNLIHDGLIDYNFGTLSITDFGREQLDQFHIQSIRDELE